MSQKMKQETVDAIERFFNQACVELQTLIETDHIRMNLMVPGNDHKLRIVAKSRGYEADELTVSFGLDQGCSGRAWKRKLDTIADLTEEVDPERDWGVPHDIQQKVNRNLKAIASIPMFASERFTDVDSDVIAILNIDSERDISTILGDLNKVMLQRYSLLVRKLMEGSK